MPRLGRTKPGLQAEAEVAQAQLDSVLLKVRCATKIWNGFCISKEWRGCYGALSLFVKRVRIMEGVRMAALGSPPRSG
jgi:hypothetical protein